MKRSSIALLAIIGLLIGAGFWWMTQGRHHGIAGGGHTMSATGNASGNRIKRGSDTRELVIPTLSETAEIGQSLFEGNCAACHGPNASGSENGPPLVHRIYEPSHHGDASFYSAVANGVRAHHWRFGAMPRIEGISEDDVTKIIAYVRELQRANGIN